MARVLGLWVGAVTVSAGCAQLAGIDNTNDHARGGDAVAVTRMSIGATVETAPLDLSGQQAMYLVASASNPTGFDRVLAADQGQGRWTADLLQPAPVELTLPDVPTPIPRLFAFPSREIAVRYDVLEHPNPSPPPDGAMLALTVTLDAATVGADRFQVLTVGSWTAHDIVVTPAPSPTAPVGVISFAYPFSTSSSLTGRPLDRLTAKDVFLVLRYVGAVLTGFAMPAPFDQTASDTLTMTMADNKQDQMLSVKLDPTQLAARYTAARPAVGSLAMNWNLVAAPAARFAQGSGPVLQSGGLAATDVGVTTMYGNPFAASFGWDTVFTLDTHESRVYTPPGTMTPVTLFAGMSQVIEPSPGFVLSLPAGLPELISLDNKSLSTDGQTIPPPTRFVEAKFIADLPGATLYNLQVFDLLPNAAANGLEYHLVLAAAGTESTFELPPEIFQVGHSYTLRAICTSGGFPNALAGDLVTRTLPIAQSFLDSAVITVKP